MKRKSLLLLLVTPLLLAGCNNKSGGGKGGSGEGTGEESPFVDEKIKSEVQVNDSVKQSVRSKVKNYSIDFRMITDSNKVKSLQPSEYYNACLETSVNERISLDYAKQTLFMDTFNESTSGEIKKDGSRYYGTGFFERLNVEENQEYFKRVYEYYAGDSIYSFGRIESLRSLYATDLHVNVSGTQASMGVKIEDAEWYNKIVCTKYESEGNFTVGLSVPITANYNIELESGTSMAMSETFGTIEMKFVNYRIEYMLYSTSTGYADLPIDDLDFLFLGTFSYNV